MAKFKAGDKVVATAAGRKRGGGGGPAVGHTNVIESVDNSFVNLRFPIPHPTTPGRPFPKNGWLATRFEPAPVENDSKRDQWNEDAIRLAEKHGRTVTFSYEKKKGPGGVIELRSLRPDTVYLNNDKQVVVVGEDGDRQDVRAFRLDRIVGYVSIAGGRR